MNKGNGHLEHLNALASILDHLISSEISLTIRGTMEKTENSE